MLLEHKAGDKLFVDYAGPTLPIPDPKTGEVTDAQIFGGCAWRLPTTRLPKQIPDADAAGLDRFAYPLFQVPRRRSAISGARQPEERGKLSLAL